MKNSASGLRSALRSSPGYLHSRAEQLLKSRRLVPHLNHVMVAHEDDSELVRMRIGHLVSRLRPDHSINDAGTDGGIYLKT